jgi:hypothetical protein
MTLREKLADWISGGLLTYRADAYCEMQYKHDRLYEALRAIAAMETPSANATVRRMARTAQEAVK